MICTMSSLMLHRAAILASMFKDPVFRGEEEWRVVWPPSAAVRARLPRLAVSRPSRGVRQRTGPKSGLGEASQPRVAGGIAISSKAVSGPRV